MARRAWPDMRTRLAQVCSLPGCPTRRSWWHLRRRVHGMPIDGAWYCSAGCAEAALAAEIREVPAPYRSARRVHRLPLGLMLVSSGLISPEQLRLALDAQHNAGRGRLGEWLLELNLATELQVTEALGRQWGCGHLKTAPALTERLRALIPLPLLQSLQMIPAEFSVPTNTLRLAFGGQIDRGVVGGLETMLECAVRPCIVSSSTCLSLLQELERLRRARDIVFEVLSDAGEIAHIVVAYADRIGAQSIRRTRMGRYFWVRLLPSGAEPLNLLFGPSEKGNRVPPAPGDAANKSTGILSH